MKHHGRLYLSGTLLKKVACPVQNKESTTESYKRLVQCEGSTTEGSNCPVKDNMKQELLKVVTVQYSVKEEIMDSLSSTRNETFKLLVD